MVSITCIITVIQVPILLASIVMDRGVCNINNTSFLVNSNILTSEVIYPLYLFCGNKDGSVEQPVIMNLEYF